MSDAEDVGLVAHITSRPPRRKVSKQPIPELRVAGDRDLLSDFGSRVSGFRFRVSGFGFRISGFGFRVSLWGFGSGVAGLGFRGFRVSGFGFRVEG